MSQTSGILALVVIFSFIIGIILMAIAQNVDGLFFIGLGLFFLGVMILVVSMIWSVAGWADKQTRKYFD